jgi:hypothetical protein
MPRSEKVLTARDAKRDIGKELLQASATSRPDAMALVTK